MREPGAADGAAGSSFHDHVCWVFDHRADFVGKAVEFLAEGRRRGHRLAYVGSQPTDVLLADLAPLGDVQALIDSDALCVASITQMYPAYAAIDPFEQVGSYRRATAEALRAGFTGFRVAADATDLVLTDAQRDAFTRYEHLVDRLMATTPFSAMCGYDRNAVGERGAAELACLHPLGGDDDEPPFHLFAADGDRLGLSGEIDAASEPLLRWALTRVDQSPGEELRIDARHLAYVDHRALLVLDRRARDSRVPIVLEGATPTTRKVASMLQLAGVQVEVGA
ncbi:MAG: MEDS domain-containing protein [Actinomycetota bacterium]|nr:MEDS domain-containing protein [Actinomycetota bacterium]